LGFWIPSRRQRRLLFVLALHAHDAPECLHALVSSDLCTDLVSDSLRSLVAEFFRGEWLNHLRGRLGGASEDDPL
jgi:hypothetical protein